MLPRGRAGAVVSRTGGVGGDSGRANDACNPRRLFPSLLLLAHGSHTHVYSRVIHTQHTHIPTPTPSLSLSLVALSALALTVSLFLASLSFARSLQQPLALSFAYCLCATLTQPSVGQLPPLLTCSLAPLLPNVFPQSLLNCPLQRQASRTLVTHSRTHTQTHTHSHAPTHTYTRTHIHTYTYTYIHIHTHTQTHTHIQKNVNEHQF